MSADPAGRTGPQAPDPGLASAPRVHSGRFLLSHGGLLWRVTRNELTSRHAGSLLGAGWALVSPLLILCLYAAVYLFVFRVQLPGLSPAGSVLYVFSGLTPFLMTAEALQTGVGSVVANKFLLSTGALPIDLAPAKAVLASQGTMAVGIALVVGGGLARGSLPWTAVLFPLLWALYLLGLTGLLWVLSLLHVVFRDLQSLMAVALTITFIASPIAYTPDMVPPLLRPMVLLNPFAYWATAFQQVLVLGTIPGPGHLAALLVMSLGAFAAGGAFFGRAKRVLVDYV